MSAKLALCANTLDLPFYNGLVNQALFPIGPGDLDFKVELVDRAVCESEPARKQLLPYLVARRIINNEPFIFRYRRGTGGGEAKLHDKYSIGLGGHVDVEPMPGSTLYETLQHEAAREFEEECGIFINPERFVFSHFICDPMPDGNIVPVGSVHVGILCVLDVTDAEARQMTGEASIVVDPVWVDPSVSFTTDGSPLFAKFENWSRMVVEAMWLSNGAYNARDIAGGPFRVNHAAHFVITEAASTLAVDGVTLFTHYPADARKVMSPTVDLSGIRRYTIPSETGGFEMVRVSDVVSALTVQDVYFIDGNAAESATPAIQDGLYCETESQLHASIGKVLANVRHQAFKAGVNAALNICDTAGVTKLAPTAVAKIEALIN